MQTRVSGAPGGQALQDSFGLTFMSGLDGRLERRDLVRGGKGKRSAKNHKEESPAKASGVLPGGGNRAAISPPESARAECLGTAPALGRCQSAPSRLALVMIKQPAVEDYGTP